MMAVASEWGMAGIELLRGHLGVLVIVDVLSFSTAVDIAMSRGATVYPFAYGHLDAAQAEADRVGAILARPRPAAGTQLSLSPVSLMTIPAGTRLVLPSPNGSRLSLACGDTPVLTGCLRNAPTVARAARKIAGGRPIGVIPAGERWPDGSMRPAIEDLLGAGAIIQELNLPCSPEARVARDAFRAAGDDLAPLIRTSRSGRELSEAGFSGDVELAVEYAVSSCTPRLVEGAYRSEVRGLIASDTNEEPGRL